MSKDKDQNQKSDQSNDQQQQHGSGAFKEVSRDDEKNVEEAVESEQERKEAMTERD